jgi:hypothetical protein
MESHLLTITKVAGGSPIPIVLNGEVLVGRNILNRYVINFDGPKLIFTISS